MSGSRETSNTAALDNMHEQKEDISNKASGHKANLSNPKTSEESKKNSKQALEELGGEQAFYGKQGDTTPGTK